jgi:Holliday junction resolvase RusA-like endonuclease
MDAHTTIAPDERRKRGRKPSVPLTLDLPLAPSVNGLTFNVPGKGRRKTERYSAWLKAAGRELAAQRCPKFTGHVNVSLFAGIPKRSRDIDGTLKAALDLLEAHGIVVNDRLVVSVAARWDRTIPTGRMRLIVRSGIPPELRMSEEGRQRLSASRRGKPHASARNAVATARAAECASTLHARA